MVQPIDDILKNGGEKIQEISYVNDVVFKNEENIQETPCVNENADSNRVQKVVYSSKGRTVRNALIVGFAYFLYFTGFWPLSNLQSTMNAEGGMGVDSQAVIYLCAMISCFFPQFLMEKFGTKSTYVIGLLLGCPYIAANFKPRWDIMMISSILCGVVTGPLNAALSVYLDEMSTRYAASSDENREHISAFFFGLSMFFSEFTQVVGNIVSYYILLKGHAEPPRNISVEKICGIHFDPSADNQTNTNLDPPSEYDRHVVTGTFLALALLSVVVAMLLDPLKNDVREVKGCHSVMQRITSTVKQLKNPHQLLLLPLSIYIGIEGSFYSAEFEKGIYCMFMGSASRRLRDHLFRGVRSPDGHFRRTSSQVHFADVSHHISCCSERYHLRPPFCLAAFTGRPPGLFRLCRCLGHDRCDMVVTNSSPIRSHVSQ